MLPAKPNSLVVAWFDWWCLKAMREQFRRVHLYGQSAGALECFAPTKSRIYSGNHHSFWDGIILNYLCRGYGLGRMCMIDQVQVEKHPFFRRIGGFSVDRASPRDGMAAVKYAADQLNGPNLIAMFIFPQGKIHPPAQPLEYQNGIGHIVRQAPVPLVPMALRYAFWGEQRAEAMVWIGDPLYPKGSPREATQLLKRKIELGQSVLAEADAQQRPGDRVGMEGKVSISHWKDRLPFRKKTGPAT